MRIKKMRGVASVLALSFAASTTVAAEPTPSPTLWTASQEAGNRSSVRAQTAGGPATGNPRTDSTFFKTTAGKLTLGLMLIGVGFTVYSVNHDRKPVKSPIR